MGSQQAGGSWKRREQKNRVARSGGVTEKQGQVHKLEDRATKTDGISERSRNSEEGVKEAS